VAEGLVRLIYRWKNVYGLHRKWCFCARWKELLQALQDLVEQCLHVDAEMAQLGTAEPELSFDAAVRC